MALLKVAPSPKSGIKSTSLFSVFFFSFFFFFLLKLCLEAQIKVKHKAGELLAFEQSGLQGCRKHAVGLAVGLELVKCL